MHACLSLRYCIHACTPLCLHALCSRACVISSECLFQVAARLVLKPSARARCLIQQEIVKTLIPGTQVPDLAEGSLTTLVCPATAQKEAHQERCLSGASTGSGLMQVDAKPRHRKTRKQRLPKGVRAQVLEDGAQGGVEEENGTKGEMEDRGGLREETMSASEVSGADGAAERRGGCWRLETLGDASLLVESDRLLEHLWEPYPYGDY